jgi:hypothetical protein
MNTKPAFPPIRILARGGLYRGLVELPAESHQALIGGDAHEGLFERHIFFERPASDKRAPAVVLRDLLATVWGTDTSAWLDRGLICNVRSAKEQIETWSVSTSTPEDWKLFECGFGSKVLGVGPELVHYCREDEVDIYTSPKVAARLRIISHEIETAYRGKD